MEIQPTWPEFLGYGLAVLFLLMSARTGYAFGFANAGERQAAFATRGAKVALVAALWTWAAGAWLGWFWLSAWPFLGMGCLLAIQPTQNTQIPPPGE